MTNMRLGMLLEVATTVGAVAGGVTAVLIQGRVLQAAFAVLLVYVAWMMNRRRGDAVPERTGVLEDSYYDPALGEQVTYGCKRVPLGFVLSLAAGNISGLLGVGGGAFKVPVMNLLMGIPLKATIATSNLMIGVTAAASAAIFYGRGYMDPRLRRAGGPRHPAGRALRPGPGRAALRPGPGYHLPGGPRRVRGADGPAGGGGACCERTRRGTRAAGRRRGVGPAPGWPDVRVRLRRT